MHVKTWGNILRGDELYRVNNNIPTFSIHRLTMSKSVCLLLSTHRTSIIKMLISYQDRLQTLHSGSFALARR